MDIKIFFCNKCKEIFCGIHKGKTHITCTKCKESITWLLKIPSCYRMENKFHCKPCKLSWKTRHLHIKVKCRRCYNMCKSMTIGEDMRKYGSSIFKIINQLKNADSVDSQPLEYELDILLDKFRNKFINISKENARIINLGRKKSTRRFLYHKN